MSSNPSNEGLKVIDKRPQFDESPSLPAHASPNAVVIMAMQKGYTPELIEKMMALQERNDANEARKAFFEAVANFKSEAPRVKKDKFNSFFKSNYTSLGNLLDTYNPVLGKHGLSISFPPVPQQEPKTLTVEGRLSHRLGHAESITMSAPVDQAAVGKQSGERSRNPIQDIRSTFTYLRSMICEALLGVAGTEGTVDDDGNGSGDGKMTPYEQWEIKATEACEAANTLEDIIGWWPDFGTTIKKELKKAEAAKIYDMVVARKKELQAGEREPGSDDK